MGRSWAEDEAKQAQAQGQALEEARKCWENQGLEVDTTQDKGDNNPEQTKDIRMELENLFQQVTQQPQQGDAVGEDFKSQVNLGRPLLVSFLVCFTKLPVFLRS